MKLPVVVASLFLATTTAVAAPASRGLTLYHWWTSASELAAVDALVDGFKKKYPEVSVQTQSVDSHGGGRRIFQVVSAAIAHGQSPDSFQIHVGAPLRPYFAAELVSPLDEVWASTGLDKAVPPMIQAMSKIDGRYYAIPINVHRNNLIWYNKPLLDRHKIDPQTLTTWPAFFKAADKLRAGGVRSPVQMGMNWTASVTFESIMASLGMPAYEDWVNGRVTRADDPRLIEAFGLLKTYIGYANADHAELQWDVPIQRVIKGESAFCLMGDWANGEFRLAKAELGKDYGVIPVPGTKGLYGVTIDAFAQARGLPNPTNSDRFMRLLASREGQDAFNVVKGSISARSDADVTKYDPYQRFAIAELKAARVIYPNLAISTHDAFKLSLDELMLRFEVDLDVARAADTIAASAARSEKKFTRTWSLK
jgi:glucose/mannose transport system substrate-binding protein